MPSRPAYAYLDTSAFVKLCWPEPESSALMSYLQSWPLRASSALLWTEVLRAAQRQPVPRIGRVQTVLRRVALIDLDRSLFRQAGMLLPPDLRSLDAIHLAAALALGPD
ncbi:MAG: type II toxin-antitoxin system VapC family toxin, partial [Candidatus Dormibacteraceae bacterium]